MAAWIVAKQPPVPPGETHTAAATDWGRADARDMPRTVSTHAIRAKWKPIDARSLTTRHRPARSIPSCPVIHLMPDESALRVEGRIVHRGVLPWDRSLERFEC